MNTETGDWIEMGKEMTRTEAARRLGTTPDDLIEIVGKREHVGSVSRAIKQRNKARRKRQRASRKKNRR